MKEFEVSDLGEFKDAVRRTALANRPDLEVLAEKFAESIADGHCSHEAEAWAEDAFEIAAGGFRPFVWGDDKDGDPAPDRCHVLNRDGNRCANWSRADGVCAMHARRMATP